MTSPRSCCWNYVVEIQTQVYVSLCLTFVNSVLYVIFQKGKCNHVLPHIKSCRQDESLQPHPLSFSPSSVTLNSRQFPILTALPMNTLLLTRTFFSFGRLLPIQTSRFSQTILILESLCLNKYTPKTGLSDICYGYQLVSYYTVL